MTAAVQRNSSLIEAFVKMSPMLLMASSSSSSSISTSAEGASYSAGTPWARNVARREDPAAAAALSANIGRLLSLLSSKSFVAGDESRAPASVPAVQRR